MDIECGGLYFMFSCFLPLPFPEGSGSATAKIHISVQHLSRTQMVLFNPENPRPPLPQIPAQLCETQMCIKPLTFCCVRDYRR